MKRGQAIVVVAILLMVVLLLLAVAVDVGRLFVARARLQRAAQAAADAGIGIVADRMVTLAIPRLTEGAARAACVPDAGYGTPGASCTATPSPRRAEQWLTDADRSELVAPAVQTQAAAEALAYARRNGLVTAIVVGYPDGYLPQGPTIKMRVSIRAEMDLLFSGLLGGDELHLEVEALSEIRQR
ncbi:MAG TPA: pilus assembly protein TadG-related protein [Anaerolineales bacterium]|nr:pilus assembly protein TadG-related protein [Anaerolineales bacterium]